MQHNQHNKFADATVLAAFESQDEAEDALLGLRSAGFKDRQIGYYCLVGNGMMRDYLADYHRFAAAMVWGAIGLLGGLVLAWIVYVNGTDIDWFGLSVTCGVFGALLLGTLGGMMGLSRPLPGAYISLPEGMAEPYVMAVAARNAPTEARTILEQHGGHEMHIEDTRAEVK